MPDPKPTAEQAAYRRESLVGRLADEIAWTGDSWTDYANAAVEYLLTPVGFAQLLLVAENVTEPRLVNVLHPKDRTGTILARWSTALGEPPNERPYVGLCGATPTVLRVMQALEGAE